MQHTKNPLQTAAHAIRRGLNYINTQDSISGTSPDASTYIRATAIPFGD